MAGAASTWLCSPPEPGESWSWGTLEALPALPKWWLIVPSYRRMRQSQPPRRCQRVELWAARGALCQPIAAREQRDQLEKRQADDMAEWIYFLYPPRDDFAETMTDLERQVWARHFARLQVLLFEGVLVLAGSGGR